MNKTRWHGTRDHKLEKLAMKMYKHAKKTGYSYVTMFTLDDNIVLWAKKGKERTADEYLNMKED